VPDRAPHPFWNIPSSEIRPSLALEAKEWRRLREVGKRSDGTAIRDHVPGKNKVARDACRTSGKHPLSCPHLLGEFGESSIHLGPQSIAKAPT
jgi:hypothetical protein